jgi:anti-sigma B factor antagonist
MSAPTNLLGDMPEECPVCGMPVAAGTNGSRGGPCPRCGHLLWFMSRRNGDVTVIHLINTGVAVMELLDLLDNAVIEGMIRRLVIEFGSLHQVSSAALAKLVKLMNRADTVRGKLKLCGLHEDLRHVFRITRLDRVFDIYDTEADALDTFEAVPSAV